MSLPREHLSLRLSPSLSFPDAIEGGFDTLVFSFGYCKFIIDFDVFKFVTSVYTFLTLLPCSPHHGRPPKVRVLTSMTSKSTCHSEALLYLASPSNSPG